MKILISIISLVLVQIGLSDEPVVSGKQAEMVLQVVGAVYSPCSVAVKKTTTFEDFFKKIKTKPWAYLKEITVVRISSVHGNEKSPKGIVLGRKKELISFKVDESMQMQDVNIRNGDIIHLGQKLSLLKYRNK